LVGRQSNRRSVASRRLVEAEVEPEVGRQAALFVEPSGSGFMSLRFRPKTFQAFFNPQIVDKFPPKNNIFEFELLLFKGEKQTLDIECT
jgi:hypothetical protein